MNLLEKIELATVVSIPFLLMILFITIGIMIIIYFLHKYKKIKTPYYKGIKIALLVLFIVSLTACVGYYTIINPMSEINTPITVNE